MWSIADIPSRNAGGREFEVLRDNPGYDSRQRLLRELYREFGKSRDMEDIYTRMHGLKEEWLDVDEERLRGLEELADSMPQRWRGGLLNDTQSHWIWVNAECADREAPRYSDLSMVKVYVSPAEMERAQELFDGAVRLLLSQQQERFHAKIARFQRNDSLCFWVSRQSFALLEEYFGERQQELVCPLPFIPYRGKLGISRELRTFGSHSSEQADLIHHYFRSLEREEDVDLGEMYALYVRAWNGELPEEHPLSRYCRGSNAQVLLLLLDSIDVITGRTKITDDHLFMQEDDRMWRALGFSHRWEDVERLYQRGW